MSGAIDSFIQIGSVLCMTNCSVSPTTYLPDCENSQPFCCSPDPLSCFSFYTCFNDIPQNVFCSHLESFNANKLTCESADVDCYPKCRKRCETDDNGNAICYKNEACCLPNPDNCKYFTTCYNNNIGIGQCPTDASFDELQLSCLPKPICYQGMQDCIKICDPNATNCTEDCCRGEEDLCSENYYRCIKGVKFTATCPSRTLFNNSLLRCDDTTFLNCNEISCESLDTDSEEIATTSTTETTPVILQNITAPTTMISRRLFITKEFLSAIYSGYQIIKDFRARIQ